MGMRTRWAGSHGSTGQSIDLDQLPGPGVGDAEAGDEVVDFKGPNRLYSTDYIQCGHLTATTMKKHNYPVWILTGVMALLVVAIGLSFLFGTDNPVAWILIAVLVILPFLYRIFSTRNRLEWKPEYSVGVKVLDDDHKRLIDLLNSFHTAYQYHTGDEFERKALQELVDYTKYHFEREETLMAEIGYPDLDAHKAQHRAMIAEVERFLEEYRQKGHEALLGVADYLNGWLIHHINGTDKQYSPFFQKAGKG